MRHDADEHDIKALEKIRDWAHELMLNGGHDAHGPGFSHEHGPRSEGGAPADGHSLHPQESTTRPAGPEARGGSTSEPDGDEMPGAKKPDGDGDEPPKMSVMKRYSFHAHGQARPSAPQKQPVARKRMY